MQQFFSELRCKMKGNKQDLVLPQSRHSTKTDETKLPVRKVNDASKSPDNVASFGSNTKLDLNELEIFLWTRRIPELIGIMSAATAAIIFPFSVCLWFSTQIARNLFQFVYSPSLFRDADTPTTPTQQQLTPWRCIIAIAVPVIIAERAYKRQQLSWSGALSAVIVGMCLTLTSYSFMIAMLAFFFVGMRATRINMQHAAAAAAAAARSRGNHIANNNTVLSMLKRKHMRTWLNVVCNGAVPANCALLMLIDYGCGERWLTFDGAQSDNNGAAPYRSSCYALACIGAIACCCGDTLASELGSIWGGVPHLITQPGRRVPPRTNGAVSFIGTLMSFTGGAVIGAAFFASNWLILPSAALKSDAVPPQWPIILVAGIAGFVGSLIDSVLGSTLQFSGIAQPPNTAAGSNDLRLAVVTDSPLDSIKKICGTPVLDNHAVNLFSALGTALLMPHLAAWTWRILVLLSLV